jgi:hypothetical protein
VLGAQASSPASYIKVDPGGTVQAALPAV